MAGKSTGNNHTITKTPSHSKEAGKFTVVNIKPAQKYKDTKNPGAKK